MPQISHSPRHPLAAAAVDHDGCAGARQPFGGGATDAGRRAGDDRFAARKIDDHFTCFL